MEKKYYEINVFKMVKKVIKYNNCSQCKTPYQRPTVTRDNTVIEGNLVEAIKGSSEFGCETCQK